MEYIAIKLRIIVTKKEKKLNFQSQSDGGRRRDVPRPPILDSAFNLPPAPCKPASRNACCAVDFIAASALSRGYVACKKV